MAGCLGGGNDEATYIAGNRRVHGLVHRGGACLDKRLVDGWTGSRLGNLPCSDGGHWILSPAQGITSAILTFEGHSYVMEESGDGSYSVDTDGPISAGDTATATYEGSNDTAFLKLSHCTSGGTPSPTDTGTPSPTDTGTPTDTAPRRTRKARLRLPVPRPPRSRRRAAPAHRSILVEAPAVPPSPAPTPLPTRWPRSASWPSASRASTSHGASAPVPSRGRNRISVAHMIAELTRRSDRG